MPRGDRTGPMGMGPMTGRGAGFCAGNPVSGYMNQVRGFGLGFGGGRGFRRMFCRAEGLGFAPVVDEKELLSNQAELLENQLQQVKKRLKILNEETE